MANYEGRATAGLTTGIIGTGLGAINSGLLGNLFGGNMAYCNSDNMPVNRYELGLVQENSALKTEASGDKKMLEVYQYVDGRLRGIEAQLAQQAVVNAQVTANISCMQSTIEQLMSLTKTVIPITSICPEPMKLYNSWTAPTTAAT